jgi:simple sugar transport system ATP-binding protein
MEIKNLKAMNDKNLKALDNISFNIHKGEIYGIAGVDGNGQKELAEVITGLRKATGGNIVINNTDITNHCPEEIIRKKVAHIPEDRQKTGSIINFNLTENSILGITDFMNKFFLNYQKAREFTEKLITSYNIKTSGSSAICSSLSGGNLQKLIAGRELSKDPAVIVAVQPTRGLDHGAMEYLHNLFEEYRDKGMGIILISADLNEIIRLSDTIGVIYNGKLMGEFSREEADIKKIGLLMAGIK